MATNIAELRKQSKLPAKQAGGGNVQAFFEHNKPTLVAVLPKHLSADRMLKIALGALRTTPKLMECTVESLFGAIVTCSQLGLEPNTPMGHAYLIPFGNRKANRTDVQLIIGYKGLVDLARRSGQIESISARIVHENDDFDVEYGTVDEIRHKPLIFGDRGDVIGVYAVGKLKDGGRQFEFMSVAEVNKIRDGSQGYQTAVRYNRTDNPWISHWEEMAKKSAIRRLCKYLPMSIEMASAVALDGAAEAGKTPRYEDALQGEFTVEDPDGPTTPEPEPEPSAQVEHVQQTQQPPSPPPAAQAEPEARQQQPGTASQSDSPLPADHWPQERTDPETGELIWVDAEGTRYDPDRHGWSKDNRPSVTSAGVFRAKRGVAKQDEPPQAEPAPEPPKPAAQADEPGDPFENLE